MILVGFSVSRSLSLTPTRITSFSDFPAKMCFFFSFYVCSFLRSSICVSICLSTCQSVCLPSERLSVSPFVHLSVYCTSVCLLCLSAVWVPVCLSIYPSVCLLSEEVGFLYVLCDRPWRYLITLFPDRPILFWQIETRNRLSLWPSTSPIVSLLVGLFVSPSLGPSVGIFSICPFVCAAFLTAWWRLLEN